MLFQKKKKNHAGKLSSNAFSYSDKIICASLDFVYFQVLPETCFCYLKPWNQNKLSKRIILTCFDSPNYYAALAWLRCMPLQPLHPSWNDIGTSKLHPQGLSAFLMVSSRHSSSCNQKLLDD